MVIAIVGSRDGLDWDRVKREIWRTVNRPEVTKIVSGGARGVDTIAEGAAKEAGKALEVFPADWARLGKKAGFIRNGAIVSAADEVVAFWDGKSKGTMHTIAWAGRLGKPVHVYEWPAERRKAMRGGWR